MENGNWNRNGPPPGDDSIITKQRPPNTTTPNFIFRGPLRGNFLFVQGMPLGILINKTIKILALCHDLGDCSLSLWGIIKVDFRGNSALFDTSRKNVENTLSILLDL